MTKTWFTSYGIDFSGTNLPLKSNQNAMEPSVFNLKIVGVCGNELQSHYFENFKQKNIPCKSSRVLDHSAILSTKMQFLRGRSPHRTPDALF